MDRTFAASPLSSPSRARSSSSERLETKRTMSPPPPVPTRQTSNKSTTNSEDYEAISTLGLLPSNRNVSMAPMTPTLQKLATTVAAISPKSVLKRRYDFHKAVEKLVQEKFVPNHTSSPVIQPLDTSSESGYGSDQDSLSQQTVPPALPPRGLKTSAATVPTSTTTIIKPEANKKKKQVKFDSYVMLLQGLRDRDLDTIHTHLDKVSDAAMFTDEISAAFLTAIVENREDIVTALLRRGFDVNASADSTGLTGLHLAAAFNYLPLVRLLLSHGACIYTLAHSSGKKAADLCSNNLPGYQACHAYLRCMEECLGVANQGRAFASQSYHTARSDELELSKALSLTVLRKGDYPGSSWWWCQDLQGRQGYVLRELLSLNPPTSL